MRKYLAAGFLAPTSGTVLCNGQPISSPGRGRAVIFQDAGLMQWLSAQANIELALTHITNKRERSEKANAALKLVGLADYANLRPHELSGGMKQRVSIARAFAMDSDVMLMDEPFAALDAITRDGLVSELQDIWCRTGKTALLVTHSAVEAASLADRIICLGGRPGIVVDEIQVTVPRPRDPDSPAITEVVRQVHASLKHIHAVQNAQEMRNGRKITQIGTNYGVVAGCYAPDILGDRRAA